MAVAGDIAFVGLINGTTNNDTSSSSFAFIAFNGIADGDTITFADSPNGTETTIEGVLSVTFQQALAPGSIVIVEFGPGGTAPTVYLSDNVGGSTSVSVNVATTGTFVFGGGDQIYAFGGATFGAANVIAGVDFSANGISPAVPAAAIVLDLPSGAAGNGEGFLLKSGVEPTAANLEIATNFNTDLTGLGRTSLASVQCFMPGTQIATPDGLRAVEELAAGDLILTHDGRSAPVRWLGRQTVALMFSDPLRVLPIRILAGALGESMPTRDLLVSPDHALMLDGVLVQAGALVNGATITRERNVPGVITYYHVELADHSLLLAEGVPAETFIDNVDRMRFDNWSEHEAVDTAAPMAELDMPRAKSARQVPNSIRQMIAARAKTLREHADVA